MADRGRSSGRLRGTRAGCGCGSRLRLLRRCRALPLLGLLLRPLSEPLLLLLLLLLSLLLLLLPLLLGEGLDVRPALLPTFCRTCASRPLLGL